MFLILIAFLAGMLTVFAPCVLPVLPIILSGSVQGRDPYRPAIITLSLGFSIVLFTLLLKVSVLFIDIPQSYWSFLSGGLLLVFGITALFPELWGKVSHFLGFSSGAHKGLYTANKKRGRWGAVLLGAALGPVFASCSPVYFLILATVLPASFIQGFFALLAYGVGLSAVMFLIAFFGQKIIAGFRWAADPKGWFRRGLGILFLIVGIGILLGWDKIVEAWFLDNEFFWDLSRIEEALIKNTF